MKNIFDNVHSPVPEEFRRFLKRSSLEKVKIISIAILLMVFTNDKDCVAQFGELLLPFSVFIIAVAIVYLAISITLLRRNNIPQRTVDIVSLSFWCVLCAGIIPFIVLDAYVRPFPINMMMLLLCFIMLPVTDRKQALVLFGGFTAANLILASFGKPAISYMITIVVMSLMGYMFSQHIHGNYIALINKLTEETRTDFLTLVTNRKGGFERARSTLALCKRHRQICAFYMIDIDYFKDYNDNFGHYMGDNALVSVAHMIQDVFARKSDIVFRYGGEEFAVCASVDSLRSLENMAEKLRRTVENSLIEAGNKSVCNTLTVSIGATAYIPGETAEILDENFMFSMADMALYEAKQNGRNRVVVKYVQDNKEK
ncbi:MAG: GGDEF domain-containing protein [Clostridia bacterium]|nr:GGDEF domain-containing protein [Clostridia bacterium]